VVGLIRHFLEGRMITAQSAYCLVVVVVASAFLLLLLLVTCGDDGRAQPCHGHPVEYQLILVYLGECPSAQQ
jgi:hypothetical protein